MAAANLIDELRGRKPTHEPEWVSKARSLYQRIRGRAYQGLALVLAEEALNGHPEEPDPQDSTVE